MFVKKDTGALILLLQETVVGARKQESGLVMRVDDVTAGVTDEEAAINDVDEAVYEEVDPFPCANRRVPPSSGVATNVVAANARGHIWRMSAWRVDNQTNPMQGRRFFWTLTPVSVHIADNKISLASTEGEKFTTRFFLVDNMIECRVECFVPST